MSDLEQEIVDLFKEEIDELKGWSYNGKATFEERLEWLAVQSDRLAKLSGAWLESYRNEKRLSETS